MKYITLAALILGFIAFSAPTYDARADEFDFDTQKHTGYIEVTMKDNATGKVSKRKPECHLKGGTGSGHVVKGDEEKEDVIGHIKADLIPHGYTYVSATWVDKSHTGN